MFCTKCGNQVKDGTLFCTQCGAPCAVGDVVSTSDKQSERVRADREREGSKDDDDYSKFGFKSSIALALLAYGVAAGMLALILKFSQGYWTTLIFAAILATALSWAGAMLVNALVVSCVPSAVSLKVTPRKVLRFFATLIISIPFLFPAYGMVMGLIEVYFTERVRENGSTMIKTGSYVKNYPKMNAFSRLGYKWAYRINVEDKEYLGALESSMDAALSLLGEGNGETQSAGVDETAEAGECEAGSKSGSVDYAGVTPEGSERIIAQWNLFEDSQDMTQLQKEAGISKLVGERIAVRGTVENVGTTIDGGLYVTVKNERLRQSAFWAELHPDTKEMAMSLKKGDPVVLYASLTKPLVQLLPGLVLTQGYIVRQESDAKVGSDGNETDNSADKLSKEYETILREAMPYFMSAQGVPKDKLDVMVAVELKKEMNQFRELTGEEKIERLKRAQEEILPMARAMKNGGPEADAIVKKLKETKEAAQAVALSAQGDALYYAITTANTQREASDVASVWPKSRYTKTTVADDISSKLFETSTEYFNALFDIRNRGKSDWKPYIDGRVDIQCAFSPDTMIANWHVAQGVTDDMADCVPVLVSSNVDVSSLVTQPGQYKASAQTGRLRFSGTCAVIIRKGGAAEVIKEKDASLSKVYGNNFSLPKGFGYLSPSAK